MENLESQIDPVRLDNTDCSQNIESIKSSQIPSSSNDVGNNNNIRVPKCSRCRNHNLNVNVKGHKKKCRFKDCKCDKCQLIAERKSVMALQTAIAKTQTETEARLIIRDKTANLIDSSLNIHNSYENVASSAFTATKANLCPADSVKVLHALRGLTTYFRQRTEPASKLYLALIFCLLKNCEFNENAACDKIKDAQIDIRAYALRDPSIVSSLLNLFQYLPYYEESNEHSVSASSSSSTYHPRTIPEATSTIDSDDANNENSCILNLLEDMSVRINQQPFQLV